MEQVWRDTVIEALHEYHRPHDAMGSGWTAIDHWTIPGYVAVASLGYNEKPGLDIYTEADLERWWEAAQALMATDDDYENDPGSALQEVHDEVFTGQEV